MITLQGMKQLLNQPNLVSSLQLVVQSVASSKDRQLAIMLVSTQYWTVQTPIIIAIILYSLYC